MGTEQQQELKSEKRRTGSQIKTVLFTDHSIESWRPKKDRDRFSKLYIRKGEGELVKDTTTYSNYTAHWPLTRGGSGLTSTLDDYMRFAQMLTFIRALLEGQAAQKILESAGKPTRPNHRPKQTIGQNKPSRP